MTSIVLPFASSKHGVALPLEKLLVRAQLPGAFGFDKGAHTMRQARAKGLSYESLLACAMPGSWMVNNRAPSPVFRQWLTEPLLPVWVALCEALTGGYLAWLERSTSEKKMINDLVRAIAVNGQGIAAISKVLAYVVMESVPLMDDALVHAVLGANSGIAEPESADDPKAGAALFVPMMDWFASQCAEHEGALIAIAREYNVCPLDVAQVLDRVLWFETWGWTYNYGAGRQWARWSIGHEQRTLIWPNAIGGPSEKHLFASLESVSEPEQSMVRDLFVAPQS